MIIEEKSGE